MPFLSNLGSAFPAYLHWENASVFYPFQRTKIYIGVSKAVFLSVDAIPKYIIKYFPDIEDNYYAVNSRRGVVLITQYDQEENSIAAFPNVASKCSCITYY